nr:MAG TPA: hypothetical protein [Caudoviricetes sp.]
MQSQDCGSYRKNSTVDTMVKLIYFHNTLIINNFIIMMQYEVL